MSSRSESAPLELLRPLAPKLGFPILLCDREVIEPGEGSRVLDRNEMVPCGRLGKALVFGGALKEEGEDLSSPRGGAGTDVGRSRWG